jgi:hypothetical protein
LRIVEGREMVETGAGAVGAREGGGCVGGVTHWTCKRGDRETDGEFASVDSGSKRRNYRQTGEKKRSHGSDVVAGGYGK